MISKSAIKSLCSISLITLSTFSYANSKDVGAGIGVAYDLGQIGISGQYRRISLFVSHGIAFDVRALNFYNRRKTLNLYFDIGGFVSSKDDISDDDENDHAGVRMPIGISTYIDQRLQAYLQLVPHIDFNNEANVDTELGAGLRFRF